MIKHNDAWHLDEHRKHSPCWVSAIPASKGQRARHMERRTDTRLSVTLSRAINYFMLFSVAFLAWKRLSDLPYEPGCCVKTKITSSSLFLWIGTEFGVTWNRGLASLQKASHLMLPASISTAQSTTGTSWLEGNVGSNPNPCALDSYFNVSCHYKSLQFSMSPFTGGF